MQFLMLVKATNDSEAGVMPTPEGLAAMDAFSEALTRDGIKILTGGGLQPSSKATRISFAGDEPTITDGPFTETKELVAGFCLLEAGSKHELVERLKHGPFKPGEIEIRQLFGPEDFA